MTDKSPNEIYVQWNPFHPYDGTWTDASSYEQSYDDVEYIKKDTNLMVAAADLLEACIDAKQAMNNILDNNLFKESQSARELISFRTQLAQAIAKAKGE